MAPPSRPVIDRLWEKSTTIPHSGCWVWLGGITRGGYGQIGIGRSKLFLVHRVAFELFKGQIPNWKVIDHKCRVRSCWNPEHLRVVTSRQNTLAGKTLAAVNAAKTKCPRGHFYSGTNSVDSRICIICDREKAKLWARADRLRKRQSQ